MQIRTAGIDDVDDIIELWAATGLGGDDATDRRELEIRLRSSDGFFVVGEEDSGIVATAMGCYDDHRGWLKRVAVDPGRQGEGLGAALVAEVERRFLDAGVTKLRLAVWDDNDAAARFWAHVGFTELPEIRYFSKDLLGRADDGC